MTIGIEPNVRECELSDLQATFKYIAEKLGWKYWENPGTPGLQPGIRLQGAEHDMYRVIIQWDYSHRYQWADMLISHNRDKPIDQRRFETRHGPKFHWNANVLTKQTYPMVMRDHHAAQFAWAATMLACYAPDQ